MGSRGGGERRGARHDYAPSVLTLGVHGACGCGSTADRWSWPREDFVDFR
jgi:hypothetical protein